MDTAARSSIDLNGDTIVLNRIPEPVNIAIVPSGYANKTKWQYVQLYIV